jgi:tetratricopeptide (TPR) repeat protein
MLVIKPFSILCGFCFLASLALAQQPEAGWKEQINESSRLIRQGEFEKATKILRTVAEETGNPQIRAAALTNLGFVQIQLGWYLEADRNLRTAILLGQGEGADRNPKLASALNNLAALYTHMLRYGKARSLLEDAAAVLERKQGNRETLAAIWNNLGQVERSQGNLSQAEAAYGRALAILELHFGPRHPPVAAVLLNLGVLYHDRGETPESILYIRRALEIWDGEFGGNHPHIAIGLAHLARALENEGSLPDADATFRRALQIAEKCLGPEHPRVADILSDYAKLLQKTNQKAEAKELRKRAAAIRARHEKENLLHHTVDWSQMEAMNQR